MTACCCPASLLSCKPVLPADGRCFLQDLTARAKDSLVSFGERMSTRIFASYLRQQGVPAKQFDAPGMGVVTTDDFGNADVIYEQTLPNVSPWCDCSFACSYVAAATCNILIDHLQPGIVQLLDPIPSETMRQLKHLSSACHQGQLGAAAGAGAARGS
jgi:hypothetical protein